MRVAEARWQATRRFATDDRGGTTLWNLSVFMMLAAFCGLTIDTTDAFRGRTMLQATADAAALAAAIDLPDTGAAIAAARSYAARNMPPEQHGEVLDSADVTFGSWHAATRAFTPGTAAPDAVLVTVRRAAPNRNAWPATLLRIVGLRQWDIAVQAAAQRFIPHCLNDGLVAGGMVDLSSSNGFTGGFCVHGNAGVDMQNHNTFAPGVQVSMPDVPGDLAVPSDDIDANPGLRDALVEDILHPRMTNRVGPLIEDLLALDPAVTPDFVDTALPVIVRDNNYDFADLAAGRLYHIQCPKNKVAKIPDGAALDHVAIVADCRLNVGSGARLNDVLLASRGGDGGATSDDSVLSKANIHFAADVTLGAEDACMPGGGVQVFSTGSLHFASTAAYHGVQMVAAGDIELGARDSGINGVNAQAGGNITMTSNNAMGACTGGAPALFTAWYYRLVL